MDIFLLLERIQTNKFWNFVLGYLLVPIRYLLELYCFKKYNKFILREMIENDDIFDYLCRNDFEYKNRKFFKTDLVDEIEFLSGKPDDIAKNEITKDFTISLSELLETHSNFDIENYLSLTATVYSEFIKTEDNRDVKVRLYTVQIQFIRLYYLEKFERRFIYWFICCLLIVASIIFVKSIV